MTPKSCIRALALWTVLGAAFVTRSLSLQAAATESEHKMLSQTLILYSHVNSPFSKGNLVFFLVHGLDPTLAAKYYIILQSQTVQSETCGPYLSTPNTAITAEFGKLPKLPHNARYIVHANRCYDLGTYGWLLQCLRKELAAFKYFVFVNSSVRGPFVPAYAGPHHWTWFFTHKLRGNVKLVGSTINCEHKPHVQSYVWATDSSGLQVLQSSGVLRCHANREEAILNGELKLSWCLYDNKYTITSLMADQQAVTDWATGARSYCERHPHNPTIDRKDTRGLHPYEVLFVKVKIDVNTPGIRYHGHEEALEITQVAFKGKP